MGTLCCDTMRENRRRRTPIVAKWPEPPDGDVCDVDFRDFAGKIELVHRRDARNDEEAIDGGCSSVHPVSR